MLYFHFNYIQSIILLYVWNIMLYPGLFMHVGWLSQASLHWPHLLDIFVLIVLLCWNAQYIIVKTVILLCEWLSILFFP
jgi:hypothetical protein